MTHAATIADDRLEAALALPGARRSLRVAIGHLNVSLPDSVSEQELLKLERETFMRLVREPRSIARVEHMLETGKPLRN